MLYRLRDLSLEN